MKDEFPITTLDGGIIITASDAPLDLDAIEALVRRRYNGPYESYREIVSILADVVPKLIARIRELEAIKFCCRYCGEEEEVAKAVLNDYGHLDYCSRCHCGDCR